MNRYFDKILCINLDHRIDRWKETAAVLRRNKIEVERMPAIYGKDLNIPTQHGSWYAGVLGCSISHLFAVKYAQQLNLRNILILEDDVEFEDNVTEKFNEILHEIPDDWDMIYFGGSHRETPTQYTEHLYRISNTTAIHAIALNSKFFDKAISVLTNINESADISYQTLQKDNNIFVVYPHLAWQRPGLSSILDEHTDNSYTRYF